MSEKRDNIEVRLHKDGTLDEIVIEDPRTGQCLFHLEQMSDQHFWMRAYGITQDLVANIGAVMGMCDGKSITDEKGYIIGFEKTEGPVVDTNFEWEDSTNESECGEKFATPPVKRREKVAEIINRFGVACVLQEIADILRQGRKAEHEQALITELDNARTKFVAGDKALLDAKIAEMYGTDE